MGFEHTYGETTTFAGCGHLGRRPLALANLGVTQCSRRGYTERITIPLSFSCRFLTLLKFEVDFYFHVH